MPEMNGIDATRPLVSQHPDVVVILCSTYDAGDLPPEVATSGARAYLNKEHLGADTLRRLWDRPRRGGLHFGIAERAGASTSGTEPRTDRALPDLGVPAHRSPDRAQAVRHVDVSVATLGLSPVEPGPVVGDREQQTTGLLPEPHLHAAPRARAWPRSGAPRGSRSRRPPRSRRSSDRSPRPRCRPAADSGWPRRAAPRPARCRRAAAGRCRGPARAAPGSSPAPPRPASRASRDPTPGRRR